MAAPQQGRRRKGTGGVWVVAAGLGIVGVVLYLRHRSSSSSSSAPLPVATGPLAPSGSSDSGSSDPGSAPQPAADAAPSQGSQTSDPVAAQSAGGYVPFGFGGLPLQGADSMTQLSPANVAVTPGGQTAGGAPFAGGGAGIVAGGGALPPGGSGQRFF